MKNIGNGNYKNPFFTTINMITMEENKKSDHTPLPWDYRTGGAFNSAAVIKKFDEGIIEIASVSYRSYRQAQALIGEPLDVDISINAEEANAAYIVDAVNNYDRLVESEKLLNAKIELLENKLSERSRKIKDILVDLAINGKLDGDITQLDESVFDSIGGSVKKQLLDAFVSAAIRFSENPIPSKTIKEQFEEYYSNTYE